MDSGKTFEKLVHLATSNGITVRFAPLQFSYARLKGDRIAINQKLDTIEEINYNLAHELAHYYMHFDKGDTISSWRHREYEEQADRAAHLLLDALAAI